MDTTGHARRKKVRAHPAQLKAQVLAQCREPGVSVARVAREHGLNANLVHTWRRQERGEAPARAALPRPGGGAEFVPLALPQPLQTAGAGDIRVEVRRGATTVNISWPTGAATECAAWLAQWLR